MSQFQTFFKRIFWLFVVLIVLFAFSVFYFKVLIVSASERGVLESSNAKITQKKINVGASDYGYIKEIKVKVGDMVNDGDTLFRYVSVSQDENSDKNADEPKKEIDVKANARSRIKRINFYRSSYITKNDTVMELQSAEITINSIQNIKPEDISKVKVGAATETILPNKKTIKGTVKAIYPYYDSEHQTIEIESTVSEDISDALEGLPVVQKIYIQDDLGGGVNAGAVKFLRSIPNEQIQNFYLN
jgi:multidrug resistance efflux pump